MSASTEIADLRALIQAQSNDLRMLVETINRGGGPKASSTPVDRSPAGLAFLEGAWRNLDLGTCVYPRLINGVLRCPYCYGGNESLTGEYYDVVRAGDILTAKFRWLIDRSVRGCVYLRIKSQDELVGGWWYDDDLDVEELRHRPHVGEGSVPIRGMVPQRLWRDRRAEIPQWALDYYEAVRKANPGTT